MLKNSSILITGGTGSFGHSFVSLTLKKFNPKLRLGDVKKALRIRNITDTKRKNSPLLKHRDSVVIDTGKLDKQAMVAKMSKHVEEKLLKNK